MKLPTDWPQELRIKKVSRISAFGLFDYTMIPKLRRVLKLYGLKLSVTRNYRKWGDQVEVTIIPSSTKGKQVTKC